MLFILLGLAAGILSGLVGIGGAFIIIPGLTILAKMSQHQAQGTTLALLIPPIGILAAWTYYKAGHVNFQVAGLIILGFVFGGLIGAKLAVMMPSIVLKRLFAVLMIGFGVRMLF
jgi:uncharacterized membrane protein YfcA